MAAPFTLPDLCDIYRTGFTDPIAEDVPCRQVPNMGRGRNPALLASGLQWTHWVDFEPDVDVEDNAFAVTGGIRIDVNAGGDILLFTYADFVLSLHVVWVEDRYTATPGAYQRAYCIRTFRET